MRTWVVLAAVALVAVAATADTLRGRARSDPQPRPEPRATTTASRFSSDMGTLYYTDPGNCFLHGVTFPNLLNAPPPKLRSCRFSLSPDAHTALRGEAVWQPQGGLAAIPRGSSFELVSPASSQTIEVSGTAPAFKPDGTLTYVRGRELVEWSGRCRAGDRLFTLPNDNATARCLHVLLREPARSVAWLTNGRFAATLPHGDLAIFADGRSVFRTALLPAGIARVEASPRRDFFTVWLDGDLLGAFDSNGAPVVMPPVPAGRALACAPDEAWCVLATSGGSVYLFRPGTGDARLRRLDFRARDLAWRS